MTAFGYLGKRAELPTQLESSQSGAESHGWAEADEATERRRGRGIRPVATITRTALTMVKRRSPTLPLGCCMLATCFVSGNMNSREFQDRGRNP
jgi:hypothetical protein